MHACLLPRCSCILEGCLGLLVGLAAVLSQGQASMCSITVIFLDITIFKLLKSKRATIHCFKNLGIFVSYECTLQ